MSLEDPLSDYRLGPATTTQDLRDALVPRDGEVLEAWGKGGTPILLTERALFFVDDEDAIRLPKGEVSSFGLSRSSNISFMRWGLSLYLLGLVALIFVPPVAFLLAVVGGILVVKGFLSKAILIQLDDERVPPFVLEHRKWKRLRSALRDWR